MLTESCLLRRTETAPRTVAVTASPGVTRPECWLHTCHSNEGTKFKEASGACGKRVWSSAATLGGKPCRAKGKMAEHTGTWPR